MRRHLLITFLLVGTILAPPAAAYRFPVVLSGDSITESAGVRGDGYRGFGSELARALRARGIRMGGYGFVPTQMTTCCLDPFRNYFSPWTYSGSWQYLGLVFQPQSHTEYSPNGIVALGKGGSASAQLRGNRIGVMYGTSKQEGTLGIWLDNNPIRTINTQSSKPANHIYWIYTRGGAHQLQLYTSGQVILEGAMASQSYHRHLREVEVDQVGHGGDLAASNISSLQLAGLRALGPRLTLILFGANEEMKAMRDHKSYRARLIRGIKARAKNAKQGGGRCLVITHPPLLSGYHLAYPHWQQLQNDYERTARQTGRQAGCKTLGLWGRLWSPYFSDQKGWTLDGVHPTLKGYHLMSARLARWLVVNKRWWLR